MSKFIDNIMVKATGQRAYADAIPRISVKKTIKPYWSYLNEYAFIVEYRQVMRCNESELNELLKTFKRQLARDVYGELQDSMLSLRQAVYEQDRKGIIEVLNAIDNEIMGGE